MNAAAKQQRLNIKYIGLIAGAAPFQIGFRETFRPDTNKPGPRAFRSGLTAPKFKGNGFNPFCQVLFPLCEFQQQFVHFWV
jgi:hypothetical protein